MNIQDERKNIVFVILHYKTADDTIECVESIKEKIDTQLYHIVIVDNASNNGSLDVIRKAYFNDNSITVVANSKNLGFARGLNEGIRFARTHFMSEFIAAINNDTVLISRDFYYVLKENYKKYNFAVAGPMMLTKDGKCHVNPIRNSIRKPEEVLASIDRYKRIMCLAKLNLLPLYNKLMKIRKTKVKMDSQVWTQAQIDYKLHGAFWIFSDKYFEKFDGLDDSTFLYGEEDILYLHVIMNDLQTLYIPELAIYHKEDASTNEALPNAKAKTLFVSEKCIESLKIYLEIYSKYFDSSN